NSDSQLSEHTADNGAKFISLPLMIGGNTAGILMITGGGSRVAFTEEQQKLLDNIVNQIANALERARLYETLERKVEERTRELVKASKVKDEFIAMVSHELRTPLTCISSVVMLLDAAQLGSIPVAMRRFVKLAQRNCQRLMTIVNDLLD